MGKGGREGKEMETEDDIMDKGMKGHVNGRTAKRYNAGVIRWRYANIKYCKCVEAEITGVSSP